MIQILLLLAFATPTQEGARLLSAGAYPAAAEQFTRALDVDPENAVARKGLRDARYGISYRLAMNALVINRAGEARRRFQECLDLRPGDAAARKEIERLDVAARLEENAHRLSNSIAGDLRSRRWPELRRVLMEWAAMDRTHPMDTDPLAPAYRLYSQDRVDEAFRLAQRTSLAEFLNSERRLRHFRSAMPFAGGSYLLLLLLCTYAGLRKTV